MPRKIVESKPLTPYELATLLMSLTGLVSLFLISQQVNTAKRQAKALTTQSVMSQLLEVDKLFIKDPELRPYFYSRKVISEDDPNYNKVLAIAEFQLDFFDSYLTQSEYLTLSTDEEKQNWEKYIVDSFANSLPMCQRLKDAPGWYSAKLENLAKCG